MYLLDACGLLANEESHSDCHGRMLPRRSVTKENLHCTLFTVNGASNGGTSSTPVRSLSRAAGTAVDIVAPLIMWADSVCERRKCSSERMKENKNHSNGIHVARCSGAALLKARALGRRSLTDHSCLCGDHNGGDCGVAVHWDRPQQLYTEPPRGAPVEDSQAAPFDATLQQSRPFIDDLLFQKGKSHRDGCTQTRFHALHGTPMLLTDEG